MKIDIEYTSRLIGMLDRELHPPAVVSMDGLESKRDFSMTFPEAREPRELTVWFNKDGSVYNAVEGQSEEVLALMPKYYFREIIPEPPSSAPVSPQQSGKGGVQTESEGDDSQTGARTVTESTLILEVGKFYLNRKGERVGPLKPYHDEKFGRATFVCACMTYLTSGEWAGNGMPEYDLVSLAPDEEPATISEKETVGAYPPTVKETPESMQMAGEMHSESRYRELGPDEVIQEGDEVNVSNYRWVIAADGVGKTVETMRAGCPAYKARRLDTGPGEVKRYTPYDHGMTEEQEGEFITYDDHLAAIEALTGKAKG